MKHSIPRRIRRLLAMLTALLVMAMVPWPVAAQGIIIEPPFPPLPPMPEPIPVPGPIEIESTQVMVRIDGPSATVRVHQTFRNRTAQVVEGQVVFPLPLDAAVRDVQMMVDGTVLEGKLLPADEARDIYRRIVMQQRDPALLQFLGGGLFQTNVFPIPAGEARTVQISYEQLVGRDGDLFRFRYPLAVSQQPGARSGVELRIEMVNQPGLRTLYTPNHGATVQRLGRDEAEIRYASADAPGETSFDLFWGISEEQVGLNLLSYRPVEEEGYFTLLVAPDTQVAGSEIVARDLVLVLDTSGSMQGDKMEQARAAAAYLVSQLNSDDRFALISFSTGVRRWQGQLEAATAGNLADAQEWIATLDAGGSTDINRALLEALALLDGGESSARPAYVLFLTDGLPTQGETDVWRILDNAQTNKPAVEILRVFAFGVGYDVNTLLLDELSKRMGGRSGYVLPSERIDEAVSQFYRTIATPVLTNVAIEIEGGGVIDEVYPYPLPDLFAGEQLVVVGRYRAGGDVTIALSGVVNGRETRHEYSGLGLRTNGGDPFVARLWATRKIGLLMEQVRRNGAEPEVVDAIVELSLRYGIVTPFTAYLVEEPTLPGPRGGAPVGVPSMDGRGPLGIGGGPGDLGAAAEAYAADEAARMAAMPESGAGAVAASAAQNSLQTAESVAPATQALFRGGKTFVQHGWVTGVDGEAYPLWVDTAYTGDMELRWTLFGSDAYFALAEQPELATWLAVGSEMIVSLDASHALRVTTVLPDGIEELAAPADTGPMIPDYPGAGGAHEDSPSAQDFWQWLWELLFPPR